MHAPRMRGAVHVHPSLMPGSDPATTMSSATRDAGTASTTTMTTTATTTTATTTTATTHASCYVGELRVQGCGV